MLSDPFSTALGFTQTLTGGTPFTLRRTDKGKFVSTDGPFSSDQPARYSISPRIKLQGPSSVLTTWERDINVSPVNGVQQQDDTLRVQLNVSGNLRTFTVAQIVEAINSASYLFTANAAALMRGES